MKWRYVDFFSESGFSMEPFSIDGNVSRYGMFGLKKIAYTLERIYGHVCNNHDVVILS